MKFQIATVVMVLFAVCAVFQRAAIASEILGTGTVALLGGDLTDPEDDGIEGPGNGTNFNATFFASDEAGFDNLAGSEGAFNVFDNQVGGGQTKWCCGTAFPQIVGAVFDIPYILTHFTVTSGNDTDARRPRVWQIQGSNDGNTWTDIFSQDDPGAPVWNAHDQVIRWDAGTDFDSPAAYSQFRMKTDATGATTGAFFQLNEIEFFGEPIPEPSTMVLSLIGMLGLGLFRRRKIA